MNPLLNILKTIILGIIEGITEWLPISSTGHLILAEHFFSLDASHEFIEMFNVVIQFGAILAVVVIYFTKLWPFHGRKKAPASSQFYHKAKGTAGRLQDFADHYIDMHKIVLWLKILVSVLPAIVIGLPLDDWLDAHLYNPITVASMLILYGIFFILIEIRNKNHSPRVTSIAHITWQDALIIGLFQCLAMIPGTSRSGATILGGILIGLSRTAAAEYTFYLAIPTMLGASLLKVVKFGLKFTAMEALLLFVGMAVSFVISLLAIRFLMSYIRKHDFKIFGYYRIALGALVLILALTGILFV